MPDPEALGFLILFAVALGILLLLGLRGVFQNRTLAKGPDRSIGLGLPDVLVGLGLVVVGFFMAQGAILLLVGRTPASAEGAAEVSLGQQVALVFLGQLLVQGPAAVYFWGRVARRGALGRVGLLPRRPLRDMGAAALALLAGLPLVFATMNAVAAMRAALGLEVDEVAHELLEVFRQPGDAGLKAILMVSIVVLAPVIEESIFRGLLQSSIGEMLGRGRRWWTVLIVSAIFAVIHLGGVPAYALPGLFVFSLVLGWTYERTGSLWVPILIHSAFNALNVALVVLVIQQEATPQAPIPV